MSQPRQVIQQTPGLPTSDGDGVRLTRIIGSPDLNMVDPFLLLDTFESDQPGDYIGGFPSHPHRGFQTVTYVLEGRMRHKDSVGHEGVIEPGGVQWMSAGRGVVHSEMPEQENGVLFGFQLWVNLPAAQKMSAPDYQEFPSSEIPVETLKAGGTVKVIAGRTDQGTEGPVQIEATEPLYFDIKLDAGASFQQSIPDTHAGFVYVLDGTVTIGEDVPEKTLGILGDGEFVDIQAGNKGARFLLIAGKRINEPVARGGPFVMNTREEIIQAFEDYKNGQF